MKLQIQDLAVFGGKPAFEKPLPVGRPNIGRRERFLKRVGNILDGKWLTNNGPCVREFEQWISSTLGVKHCIATCNGTLALEMAIRALGMTGEVILPSFTFIATAHALKWQEITPIFCDVDPSTHNIDPNKVEALITPRTTGMIGVHLWGRPCNVEALEQVSKKHKLKVLFDAAHAFGASYKARMIGQFGDAEVLSFHATKFLNTFEGGAVVTNHDGTAEKVRLIKNFGLSASDDGLCLGTNGKMSEISAAMGLTGLESMEEFISTNYQNYRQYKRELKGSPGVDVMAYDETEKNNYQYAILELDESVTDIGRDPLLEVLRAEHVFARRYFYPGCHAMEPYRSLFPEAGRSLPHTERLAKRLLSLPTGTSIMENEISGIADIVRFVIRNGTEVRRRLETGRREGQTLTK